MVEGKKFKALDGLMNRLLNDDSSSYFQVLHFLGVQSGHLDSVPRFISSLGESIPSALRSPPSPNVGRS